MDLFSTAEEKQAELVQELLRIPSPTGGERPLVDWLQHRLQAQGWDVNREGDNLWVMGAGYDARRPTLLLLAGLDTPSYAESQQWMEALARQWMRFETQTAADNQRNYLFAAVCESQNLGENGLGRLLSLLPRVDEAELAVPNEKACYGGEYGIWEGRIRTQTIAELLSELRRREDETDGQLELLKIEGEKGRGAWAIVRTAEALSGVETLRELLGHAYANGQGELRPTTILGFLPQSVKCSLV